MPSKDEIVKKISAALNERTGGQKPCNVCNQTKWVVVEQYVVMPVVNDPTAIVLGGNVMSLTPVVCSNCGNTHLINLRVLGFSDLSELKIDDGENAKP